MGVVTIEMDLSSLSDMTTQERITAIADTGATLTIAPAPVLRKLGIQPVDTVRIRIADGRVIERQVGFGFVTVDGKHTPARLVFGEPQDPTVLGLAVLEELGLAVDPIGRRLIPADFILYKQATEGPPV